MSAATPKISAAQKALIAERTEAILKTARPGSTEYADACAERAKVGLAVPKVRHTAVDALAMEQFKLSRGADVRREVRARRAPYGLWLAGWLGVVTAGMAGYVFLSPPPARAQQAPTRARETDAPREAETARAVSSVDATAVPSTAAPVVTPVSAAPSVAASAAPSAPVALATGAFVAPHPFHPAAPTPPPPTAAPVAPPPTANSWAPAWKKP